MENYAYIGMNFSKTEKHFHFVQMNKDEFHQHAETTQLLLKSTHLNDEQLIDLHILTLKSAVHESEMGLINRATLHHVTGTILTSILVLTGNFEHALKHCSKYAICLSLDMNVTRDEKAGKIHTNTEIGYFVQPKKLLKRKTSNNNRPGTKKA